MADALENDDWQEEGAAWKRLRLKIQAALLANDMQLTRRLIGEMLTLAGTNFQTGDPRLAASIACQAWQLRDRSPALAARLFQDALAHWNQSLGWLANQPPPGRLARSSSFHLRLESKYPSTYQERRREDLTSSLALGRTLTEGLRQSPRSVVSRSEKSNAKTTSDVARKVGAAIDLLRLLDGDGRSVDGFVTD